MGVWRSWIVVFAVAMGVVLVVLGSCRPSAPVARAEGAKNADSMGQNRDSSDVRAGESKEGRVRVSPASSSSSRRRGDPASRTSTASRTPTAAWKAKASLVLPVFYQRLGELESKRRQRVRISWFGDSHTAADFLTGEVRRVLQARFGDGGPGFVHLAASGVRHETVMSKVTGGWKTEPPQPALHEQQGDGVFGLAGLRAVPQDAEARVEFGYRFARDARPLHWEVILRFGAGDRLRLHTTDGIDTTLPPARDAGPVTYRVRGSQLRGVRFDTGATSRVSLEEASGAPVLFGAIGETDSGVVLDSLGINGARARTPRGWHQGTWLGELAERNPSLIVLSYGTNEVGDSAPVERYAEYYRAILAETREVVDEADCLLIGPTDRLGPDRTSLPRVEELDRWQARLAEAEGCAYFSLFQAMREHGGFSGFRTHRPSWASSDGVHLTRGGYEQLARSLLRELFASYDAFAAANRSGASDSSEVGATAVPGRH